MTKQNKDSLHGKVYRLGTLPNSGWRFLATGETIEVGDYAYHVTDSTYIPCRASVGRTVDKHDGGQTYIRLETEDRTQEERAHEKPSPGDGFRFLRSDEIIQKGDQYRYGYDEEKQRWAWRSKLERIGFPAGDGCVYRRRIELDKGGGRNLSYSTSMSAVRRFAGAVETILCERTRSPAGSESRLFCVAAEVKLLGDLHAELLAPGREIVRLWDAGIRPQVICGLHNEEREFAAAVEQLRRAICEAEGRP